MSCCVEPRFCCRCKITTFALTLSTLHGLVAARASESKGIRDDIVIADFEAETYGEWKVEGEAFGPGPARGTLPNQMAVSGYQGDRLVNSYYRGDNSTGRLTSPPFRIERPFINFLVGGGKYPGETCVNLVVSGRIVRTATGPNDRPGGSERLDWEAWDVTELMGQTATIEIIDRRSGGWGHINVDHIVQSDRKRQVALQKREIFVEHRYLHLPVKTGAAQRRLKLIADGRVVREFEIELAGDDEPDFWAFSDVSTWRGQRASLEAILPDDSNSLLAITQGDAIRDAGSPAAELYEEKNRPQFHFTSRRGWLNDPNGLVHYDGEYHLFYQHNPYGWNWGNMHWGHAVSNDLMHWRELPIALYPQSFGDWCFSGSALVDWRNTAGFKSGDQDVLIAVYTSTGRGESIAYSNDRGRTWSEYEGNPVVRHRGRDPKVFWHQPTERWIMAVYDEADNTQNISFYTSPNLKEWEFQSRIDGFYECPDLFELRVSGAAGAATRWVLYAADGKYVLGDFDGRRFVPSSAKHQLWFGNFYAAQTFSDVSDGRRIQIGWGRGIAFPGMPFNQQMTIPAELTLRDTDDGPRMFATPVREIERLHARRYSLQIDDLDSRDYPLPDLKGDLFEIRVEFRLDRAEAATSVGVIVRGIPITYDLRKQALTCGAVTAPLKPADHRIRLQVLVDRGSIEVFGNAGAVALSVGVIPPDDDRSISITARGGSVGVRDLEVFELKSVWGDATQ